LGGDYLLAFLIGWFSAKTNMGGGKIGKDKTKGGEVMQRRSGYPISNLLKFSQKRSTNAGRGLGGGRRSHGSGGSGGPHGGAPPGFYFGLGFRVHKGSNGPSAAQSIGGTTGGDFFCLVI